VPFLLAGGLLVVLALVYMQSKKTFGVKLKLISMAKPYSVALFLPAILLAAFAFPCDDLLAQSATASDLSQPTEVRLKASGWWPTKGDHARDEYAGATACAGCHTGEA
jgi:hypothetical protein